MRIIQMVFISHSCWIKYHKNCRIAQAAKSTKEKPDPIHEKHSPKSENMPNMKVRIHPLLYSFCYDAL